MKSCYQEVWYNLLCMNDPYKIMSIWNGGSNAKTHTSAQCTYAMLQLENVSIIFMQDEEDNNGQTGTNQKEML